jgi:uncharacterized membrane-anchored protein
MVTFVLNKVPQVTLFFWIIKILSTTVGETAADFLATTLHLGLVLTSYVMSGLFVVALIVQLTRKRYVPAIYWTVVVLVSVVGTLVSDTLVDKLGVGLRTSTLIFGFCLCAVFLIWWLRERTLSVHAVNTTRRELFYWAAILFTFALGTSGGDLAAEAFGLGYALSALMFAALIAMTAGAYYLLKINGVLAFWIAYILTRPLGASTGDLLAQPASAAGLGLGTTNTSLVFLAVIVSLVAYLTMTRKDDLEATDEMLPEAA